MMAKPGTVLAGLIVLAGVLMFEFAPGGFLFQKAGPGLSPHSITHLIAGGLAAVFGAAVIAMRGKLGPKSLAIGGASLVIGLVFVLDAGVGPLFKPLAQVIPHGTGMQAMGALTIIVGLIGLVVLGKGAKVSG